MSKKDSTRAAAVLLLAMASGGLVQAQTASITGQVTRSEDGAPVAGALIEAKDSSTGVWYRATSTPEGTYELRGLPPATYSVTIRAARLSSYYHANINLDESRNLVENAQLHLDPRDSLTSSPVPAEKFRPCSVSSIHNDPEHQLYDYTLMPPMNSISADGAFDAFSGVSWLPLRLHEGGEVKCFVDAARFIYVLDDDGEVRRMIFAAVMEMVKLK